MPLKWNAILQHATFLLQTKKNIQHFGLSPRQNHTTQQVIAKRKAKAVMQTRGHISFLTNEDLASMAMAMQAAKAHKMIDMTENARVVWNSALHSCTQSERTSFATVLTHPGAPHSVARLGVHFNGRRNGLVFFWKRHGWEACDLQLNFQFGGQWSSKQQKRAAKDLMRVRVLLGLQPRISSRH